MLNDSIYKDLSARCGGRHIGVISSGVSVDAEKLNGVAARAEAEGIKFSQDIPECACVLAFAPSVEEASALAEQAGRGGLPCVAVAEGVPSGEGDAPAIYMPLEDISVENLAYILRELLFSFPVTAVDVRIPAWMRSLPAENSAIAELCSAVRSCSEKVCRMSQTSLFGDMLAGSSAWQPEVTVELSPSDGRVVVTAAIREGAFFNMLSETAGEEISDECSLMSFVVAAADARRNYDRVRDALECARVTGYGIVRPSDDDLNLEKPVVVRQGQNVGVRLKGSAPSYHIVKVDVNGEVNPIMGAAAQSEGMVNEIMNGFESDPQGMWNTDLFGKSLRGMVQEGLAGKVNSMQDETRAKLRKAITRIVNEGKGGVICILL